MFFSLNYNLYICINESMEKYKIALVLIIGSIIDWFYPKVDLLILMIEIIFIFYIINKIDMPKYREIYDKMDKNEQRLVHKLLGLLAACLIVPIIKFIGEAYQLIESLL